jgi:cytoskeletal protein RodZ
MTDPRLFGAWLQRERERRDITLRAIADRTKIGAGLLESLERGDVSRWPGGIYRRSFIRSYADMIGLDADLVLANFERLFPDPDALATLVRTESVSPAPRPAADGSEFRLQFAEASPVPSTAKMKAAGSYVAFSLGMGLLGFVAAGAVGFWCATAVTALVWHVCSVLGMTRTINAPLGGLVDHWMSRRARAREMVAELAELQEPDADPAFDLTYYAR